MARPGRELAEAHGAQLAAHRLLRDRESERLKDPGHQVDETPAHDAVDRRYRTVIDQLPQPLALRVVEKSGLAERLAGDEAGRTVPVQPQHPIAHRLKPDPADRGRLGSGASIIDRRQRQKPPDLVRITRATRKTPKTGGIIIGAEWNRSGQGEASKLTATLNHEPAAPKPLVSQLPQDPVSAITSQNTSASLGKTHF